MAEVKERNTEERATRMAERIWRETIDDSKLDIKRIRAICLFYLIAERDQAVASHAPATAGSERNELLHELECWGVIYDPQQVVEGEEPWEVICEPEPQYFDTFKEAFKFFMSLKDNPERDSPAPSAPAVGKEGRQFFKSLADKVEDGDVSIESLCDSNATQSGASATLGDLIREVEICEQNCSAWIPCKTQDVRSLLAEVETLKAERDSWREVCNQILTLRGKNKDLERTVSELRAREAEALKTDEVE